MRSSSLCDMYKLLLETGKIGAPKGALLPKGAFFPILEGAFSSEGAFSLEGAFSFCTSFALSFCTSFAPLDISASM